MTTQTPEKIILYAHPACPMVYPVRAMLKDASVNYEYVNIFDDPEARQVVREINNGYESVPTLVFPDGSTLTEPGTSILRARLQEMGYEVPMRSFLIGNIGTIIIIIAFVLAILRAFGII